jgi:hypothetical protein
MGDRTWLNVSVSRRDKARAMDILAPEQEWDESDHAVMLEVADANYAGVSDLEALQQEGIPYIAHHGAGDDYGEAVVAFDGAEQMEAAAVGGELIVTLGTDGNVDAEMLADARAFLKHQKKAEKAIAARSPDGRDQDA